MNERRSSRRWIVVIVTLLMLAPAVAAIIGLAGRHWWPTDDYAIIDLRVRDVFTSQTPLTGLYSRPGWNHPGPFMFWGLAPLSWLSGQAPWATRIGGAILQSIALVWLAVATARYRVRLLLAAGIVASLSYLAANQWLFREPWNLHIPLPYFVLFLFLTHLVAVGRSRHLIGMSFAATAMVSTHISYAPLAIAGFAYALAWTLVDARRAGRPPERWRNTLVLSGAIWLVTWIAPLLDVALHWPGNLGDVIRYFVAKGHTSVGLPDAARLMADQFRWVPPWLGGAHRVGLFTGFAMPASFVWLLVPAGLLAVATLAIRTSRDREDARMVGLAAVMFVVGIYAISNADEPRAYTFQWRATVAVFLVVACGSSVATLVTARSGRAVRSVGVLVAVALVAWGAAVMTVSVVRRSDSLAARGPDLRAVMRIVDRGPRPRGAIRLRSIGGSLPSLFDGVVNELARRGVDVRVDPPRGRIFGTGRTIARSVAAETWYVTEEGSHIPELLDQPGARVLVSTTPLSAAEDRELAALQTRISDTLDRAGLSSRRKYLDSSLAGYHLAGIPGINPIQTYRLGQLNAKVERNARCRCAIVAVPA